MKTRNLKYNRQGTVDMEINHPKFGWIPFTASADDSEQTGRDLYQQAVGGELGSIEPIDEITLEQRQQQYTRRLKSLRNQTRDAGYTTQGYKFYSDKESVADLFMAVQGHLSQGGQPTDSAPKWKTMDGYTSGLTYADLQSALLEISGFVQSCYNAESTVLDQIDALTEQDKDTFDVEQAFNAELV